MSEKRFELTEINPSVNPLDTVCFIIDYENPSKNIRNLKDCVDLLNEQQDTINKLTDEKEYWKNKAMTLLFQVRRLTPRMTDAEVKEFSKELENE